MTFLDRQSAAPLLKVLACPSWTASEHEKLHGLPEGAPESPAIMRRSDAAMVRQVLQIGDERGFGRWLWVPKALAEWMADHWDAVDAGRVEVRFNLEDVRRLAKGRPLG